MSLHLTSSFTSITVICISIISCLRSESISIASTRTDSGPKVNNSVSKKLMPFSDKYVLILAGEVHFLTKSVLMNGPQYSIYQKRDAQIEQSPGPDEIAFNN